MFKICHFQILAPEIIAKCSNGNSVNFMLQTITWNTINVLYKTQNCQNINLPQFDKILMNNILKYITSEVSVMQLHSKKKCTNTRNQCKTVLIFSTVAIMCTRGENKNYCSKAQLIVIQIHPVLCDKLIDVNNRTCISHNLITV